MYLTVFSCRLDPKAFKQGFQKLTISYDDHAYVICLSNRKIYIVKVTLVTATNTTE